MSTNKESAKFNTIVNNRLLHLIAKDVFFVSFALFLMLSWFEWREPGSVIYYFNLHLLVFALVASGTFIISSMIKAEIFIGVLLVVVSLVGCLNPVFFDNQAFNHNAAVLLLTNSNNINFLIVIFISFVAARLANNFKASRGKISADNIEMAGREQKSNTSLRKLLKFIFKKKYCASLLLLLITIIGFGLRIWNLDVLSPVRDEYNHLNAAKHLLENGYFNYQRAEIITYLTYFSWKIFNNGEISVFWARFVSVILGTISIPMIYYLVKINSNKKIALIAAAFCAFSPFHIGLSRYLREYIFYFDVMLLMLISITGICPAIKSKNYLKSVLYFLLIALFISYYFIFGGSTLIIVVILTIAFIIFYLLNNLYEHKDKIFSIFSKFNQRKFSIFIYISIMAILTVILWYFLDKYIFKSIFFEIHAPEIFWFKIFFSANNEQQWFHHNIFSELGILLFLLLGALPNLKNVFFRSVLLSFASILICYMAFFENTSNSRYIFYLLPFFMIIFSYSTYALYEIMKSVFPKSKTYMFLIIFFLLSFFNPLNTLKLIADEKSFEVDPKTGLIHRETYELIKFLDSKGFKNSDVVISPNKSIFIFHYDSFNQTKKKLIE